MVILPLFVISIATSAVFSALDIRFEPGMSLLTLSFMSVVELLIHNSETVLKFGDTFFCAGTQKWNPRFGFWIPALCYETLLCVLVLYKGYETYLSEMPLGWSGSRAIKVLVRDSAFYFI